MANLRVVKKGINGKLYRGEYNSEPDTEMTNIANVTLNQTMTEADATHRGGGEYQLAEPVMNVTQIDAEMLDIDDDPDIQAVDDAYFNQTPLALKCLDKANGRGVMGDFKVFSFGSPQPKDGLIVRSVVFKPCLSSRQLVQVKPTASGGGGE